MQLKFSITYVFVFLLLLVVMMELHELVHISVGRIICGCWGTRDFNVWSLCDTCAQQVPFWWLATLAGPLFSFAMMWIGWYWLSSSSAEKKAWGFALIFTNIPFGRLTTVMTGGGDEMVVTRNIMGIAYSRTLMILICSIIVLAITAPPVVKAWQAIKNKHAWIYIIGYLTLPLVFLLLYTLTVLNTLLTQGFLANPWMMGTPLLITLHTLLAVILLIIFRKSISRQVGS